MPTGARVAGGILIAALAGFVLARTAGSGNSGSGGSASALTRHARAAGFAVGYPADWTRSSTAPSGLVPALGDPVALAPLTGHEVLVIGSTHLSAADTVTGALPADLRITLSTRPVPERVTLGTLRFYRYSSLRPRGQGITESVYLLATTAGTIGAVCAARTAGATFIAECQRVLATVRLTKGTVSDAGADRAYAAGLNAVLAQLNAARAADGPALRGSGLSGRAVAAGRLAVAHTRAATAVRHLRALGTASINGALVAALTATADGYRSLAAAIRAGDAGRYHTAQARIAADATALDGAFARLREIGYRIG